MKTIKFNFYNDPGHGWIAVKRSLLVKLGIQDKISHCSYQKGFTCYLEEDCDATLLLTTLDKLGIKYEIKDIYHERTPIRGYANYSHVKPITQDDVKNLIPWLGI